MGGAGAGPVCSSQFLLTSSRVFLEALDPKAQLAPLEKKEKRWEM